MLNARLLIVLLLSCVARQNLSGQGLSQQDNLGGSGATFYFRHIDQASGLSHNSVLGITQDDRGFIWVANRNGLQRYDGSRFLNIPSIIADAREPRAEAVALFSEAGGKRLFISTSRKLQSLSAQTRATNIFDTERQQPATTKEAKIFLDHNGESWLLTSNAVFYLDPRTREYALNTFNSNPDRLHTTTSLWIEKNGDAWLTGNASGLYFFDHASGNIYSPDHNPKRIPLIDQVSRSIDPGRVLLRQVMKDAKGNFWITTWGEQFFRYDASHDQLSAYSVASIMRTPAPAAVNVILEDRQGTVWLGTENAGLIRYTPSTGKFETIAIDGQAGTPNASIINCIFQDKDDNIWLGSNQGLTIFNPYGKHYRSIRHQPGDANTISRNEINCVVQLSNGDRLAGTWGGGITFFDSAWNVKRVALSPDVPDLNLVWCMLRANDGKIWIGCQHGHLQIYDPTTSKLTAIQPPELHHYTVRAMAKDADGDLWFGLHDGAVARWNSLTGEFFPNNQQLETGKKTAVTNIFFDQHNQGWIGTERGLGLLNKETRQISERYLPGADTNSISGAVITGIEQLNDSMLAIGTMQGGINLLNLRTRRFSRPGGLATLSNTNIHAIRRDQQGRLWFTTDYGLESITPPLYKVSGYNIADGVIRSAFDSPVFYPGNDGQLVTSTPTEILSFDPAISGQPTGLTSGVQITRFSVFDKELLVDSIVAAGKPIELNASQNFLSIDFADLHFLSLQKKQFFYKLDPVDAQWINAGERQSATYTNLSPGSYVFHVKAESGGQTVPETTITFVIAPPFWMTTWFGILLALLIVLIITGFVMWRIASVREVAAEKLKVQKLSSDTFRNKLEMEQIINYFSSSLIGITTVDEVLWDVSRNLIGRLGFEDCMIYLWNADKTSMIQRAGFGPKGSMEQIEKQPFTVTRDQGVVGYVMRTKEPVMIPDTRLDPRYRVDEMVRLSEVTVPIIYDDELIGIIDSEHSEQNFYNPQHLQILGTIGTLMANKIQSIRAEDLAQQARMEVLGMNEKLSAAKLEALRSQMNPHFIFNCLISIENLIQKNEKELATAYLAKFAKLIRSILETSRNNVVPCWKDMETLKLYLEMEELRMDHKFSYRIDVAPNVVSGDYKVPPLIIQPFVENAIHHGLLNKITMDRTLFIGVTATENCLHYVIEDNGVGRARAGEYKRLNKPAHESMGMQMSVDRINLFNNGARGAVKITDLYDATSSPAGTRVEIQIFN